MNKINRRDLIKRASLLSLLTLPFSQLSAKSSTSEVSLDQSAVDNNQLLARKKARNRTRRIIMNNDGNDINVVNDGFVTPELFLNARTSPLIGSQVDSFFYCDGVNNKYSHSSKLTDLPLNNKKAMRTIQGLQHLDTDPLAVMVDFCKQHNKEIFWSMRMNDLHDAAATSLTELTKWKMDHPEYLMGTPNDKSNFLYKWTALDYGKKEVRERILLTIKDVVERYEVDGIELDFFRHPLFFKSQYVGAEATAQELAIMTELVKQIRSVCDAAAAKKGNPVLIAIRVPDSLAFSKAIGLDVANWLEAQYIDLMSAGDYFKLEPWKNWAAFGNKYKVPVYAVLTQRRISETLNPEDDADIELWRGESIIAWEAGVNGIYTFNCFKPEDPLFRELGDLAMLKKLPHKKIESYINPQAKGVVNPDTWLKNARKYLKKASK